MQDLVFRKNTPNYSIRVKMNSSIKKPCGLYGCSSLYAGGFAY